jgi:5-methylcytosine-specific restriction endonuclease McrA
VGLLPLPSTSASQSFAMCVGGVSSRDERDRLVACSAEITKWSEAYKRSGDSASYHSLRGSASASSQERSDMRGLYKNQMVRRGSPGRPIYDAVLNSSPNGMCPYCGQSVAATIDHYLPQSEFPFLSVTPENLVPSCDHCNYVKRARTARCRRDAILNPYFDEVDIGEHLIAQVQHTSPPSVSFVLGQAPIGSVRIGANDLLCRLHTHFDAFQLGELYSVHAGVELSGLRRKMESLLVSGGEHAVVVFAREMHASHASARTYRWKSAMYLALSRCSWFCSGGFSF